MTTNRKILLGVAGVVFVVIIPLVAMSCASTRDVAVAASQEFRTRVTARAYGAIVQSATPEFQTATTEADFARVMEALKQRLGGWQSSEPPAWRVLAGLTGRTVTLVYSSHFERGTATEEFVWRIQQGQPRLAGYHVKSAAPVTQ
jgi:hypothetical protein